MPQDYEIKQVLGTQDVWDNDYGVFTPYEILLEGPGAPDATVTLNRKQKDGAVPQDKVPKVGETLHGSITQTNFGYRFKAEQKDSRNGSGSKPAGDDFARRPDHPDNAARARHSTALSNAPAYYELLRTEGVVPKAESKAQALETLTGLIQWLEQSYPVSDNEIAF